MAAANAATRCSCSETTGKDTCVPLGQCAETPCSLCQTCLTTMQDSQNVSAIFASTGVVDRCDNLISNADCTAIRDKYFPDATTGEALQGWLVS